MHDGDTLPESGMTRRRWKNLYLKGHPWERAGDKAAVCDAFAQRDLGA